MNGRQKRTAAPCLTPQITGSGACDSCGIYHVVLLEQLIDKAELEPSLRRIERIELAPGECVYQEKGTDDCLFTIRSGLVKAIQYLPDGTQRIVRLYNQGSALGVERLLGLPYEHTVAAIGHVDVCRIPVSVVGALDEDSPRLYEELIEHWHSHVRQADTWITQFSTGSVRARVARLLLYLAQLEVEAPKGGVELLHGEEMAAVLGVTPESVSRTVAEFKRNDILHVLSHTPRERYSYDRNALESIAFGC